MTKRILLVDDSPSIRSLIRLFLVPHGYEFVEAESGERALSVLKIVPADLVIVDVNMPGMGGLEFIRQVRAHARAHVRGVSVMLLTGDSNEALQAEGAQLGANAFLSKPVQADRLNQLVGGLLSAPSWSAHGA